jgi:hypothetical protein
LISTSRGAEQEDNNHDSIRTTPNSHSDTWHRTLNMGVAKKTRKFSAVSIPSPSDPSFKTDTPPGQENNRAKRRKTQEEPSQGRNRIKEEGKGRRDSARSVHLPPNLQFLLLIVCPRPQVSSALFFQVCLSQYCSAIFFYGSWSQELF